MVDGKPSYPCGETFVEPKLAPPVHGDEITEPLMGKFVSDDIRNSVSVAICGSLWVEKHRSRS